jgi:aspartate racemase
LGVFEKDPLWNEVKQYIVYPKDEDQERIHEIIYTLKQNFDPSEEFARMEEIASKYSCKNWLLGCTELHLFSSFRKTDRVTHSKVGMIDALAIAAEQLLLL